MIAYIACECMKETEEAMVAGLTTRDFLKQLSTHMIAVHDRRTAESAN